MKCKTTLTSIEEDTNTVKKHRSVVFENRDNIVKIIENIKSYKNMKTNSKMVNPLTKEEIRAIEVFYSAWAKKQPRLLEEVCTPDWQDIPLAPDQKDGPKGLQEIMSGFIANFPDIEVIIHEIFGTHERAGVRAELTFTHHKKVLGIPATNTKVSLALHEFYYLKNGKLTHTWHLEDWFGLLMQSGIWPIN